jgi:hypothetical protein
LTKNSLKAEPPLAPARVIPTRRKTGLDRFSTDRSKETFQPVKHDNLLDSSGHKQT